jgi:hypothetical protein
VGGAVQVVEPHCPRAKTSRPPFAVETMLRIYYLQQWFGLSDPAMEEALHDVPLYREFANLGEGVSRLPDETTIRHGGACAADLRAQLDQKRRGRTRPGDEADQEGQQLGSRSRTCGWRDDI